MGMTRHNNHDNAQSIIVRRYQRTDTQPPCGAKTALTCTTTKLPTNTKLRICLLKMYETIDKFGETMGNLYNNSYRWISRQIVPRSRFLNDIHTKQNRHNNGVYEHGLYWLNEDTNNTNGFAESVINNTISIRLMGFSP